MTHNSSPRLAKRSVFAAFLAPLILFVSGCGDEEVPGGQITIQNDILDKEFNSFTVDSVTTVSGATGYRKTLKPGERSTIPHKNITGLRFTRRYKDHSKIYLVTCPAEFKARTTVKLIDVHSNRLRGGCVLSRYGTMNEGGFMRWEKER